MNKTLLLILCDFLLLTLLALTRWETAEPERPPTPAVAQAETGEGKVTAADDVVALMKLSFDDEQAHQAELAAELEAKARALAEREAAIGQLQDSVSSLDSEKAQLAQHLAATQQTAAQLRDQVNAVSGDAAASKARVAQLQRDLEQREAEAAKQAAELQRLATEQAAAAEKIQNLNVAVLVAEQEKTLLRETADTYRQQAEVERQERQRVQETTVQLAEGVGQLAEKSAAITQEMRDNRPINANTLFSEFLINRVPASFTAVREGLFGADSTRTSSARTLLVSDGRQTYAVLHIEDTPFSFLEPTATWRRISALLAKGDVKASAAELRFLQRDARVVLIPVEASQAEALGVKIYRAATDPFRFPEAVLISNGGAGYGEVPFKLDAARPGYLTMDNRLLRRLVGDFSPSRGDLVLSKTGELLGVMVTADQCVMLDDFAAGGTIRTGDVSTQNVGALLERLGRRFSTANPGTRGR